MQTRREGFVSIDALGDEFYLDEQSRLKLKVTGAVSQTSDDGAIGIITDNSILQTPGSPVKAGVNTKAFATKKEVADVAALIPPIVTELADHESRIWSEDCGLSAFGAGVAVTITTALAKSGGDCFISIQPLDPVGTPGNRYITNIVDDTSFDVESDDATDEAAFLWSVRRRPGS